MKYTIIITVYNKEKYLKRCLDSVFNQKYKNYEIIIINDGSTDNSDEIIKKYQNKCKYINKENTGVADTRNIAIKEVNTPYFLFVDADDYIESNLLMEVDKYKDFDILSFNALKINKPVFNGKGEDYFIKLTKEKSMFTVPWGYIYNTKYFKDNNYLYPTGKILEDFYLTPFIIMNAKKVISIDYVGYHYIPNENSITSKKNQEQISKTYIEFYGELLKKINDENYHKKTRKMYISFLSAVLLWNGRNLPKMKQKEYLKQIETIGVFDNLKNKTIKKILIKFGIYYKVIAILTRGKS